MAKQELKIGSRIEIKPGRKTSNNTNLLNMIDPVIDGKVREDYWCKPTVVISFRYKGSIMKHRTTIYTDCFVVKETRELYTIY